MDFYVLTLFPEAIIGGLGHSMIQRAVNQGIITINCIDIRDFSGNKHRRVDDYPYGGGPGMVIRAQPVYEAYLSAKSMAGTAPVIIMSPQGQKYDQKLACELSKEKSMIIICGHYEGIDERAIEEIGAAEISLGDYILTGGEIGAMAVIDSVSRLIPGVLGKEESFANESFANGLLEYPQYTRPAVFMDRAVPEVLLSGNHKEIEKWRLAQSEARTRLRRPDLLNNH